jgi:mRNA-degrading endonuclease toxin of MazEF toxin-antitoxin module
VLKLLYLGVFNVSVKRGGEIYYADLSPVVGPRQGGIRPVLIVQNDVGNKHSPTVIAAAITSQREKAKLPTHIDWMQHLADLQRIVLFFLSKSVP